MGRILQKLRPDQPRTRRDWIAIPLFAEVGRGGQSGRWLPVFAGDDGHRFSAESGGDGRGGGGRAPGSGVYVLLRGGWEETPPGGFPRSAPVSVRRGGGGRAWDWFVV